MTSPRLSVLVLCYNQKDFVAETLAGVLRQKISEPFEIVVGDDCSSDGTAELCETLLRDFPEARVVRAEKNGGLIANFKRTLAACRGRYIALLGGDDVWTSDDKLESQLRAFDSTPGCGLCYTAFSSLIHETGAIRPERFHPVPDEPLKWLVERGNFMCASSTCFDRALITPEEWTEMAAFPMEDYPLWITIASRAKIVGIDRPMVNYRVLKGSISYSPDPKKTVRFLEASREVAKHYARKYFDARVERRIDKRFDLAVFATYRNTGETALMREFLKSLSRRRLLASTRLLKARVKILLSH